MIEINSLLCCLITDHVTVRKILGNDTRSWLLLLCNVVIVSGSIAGIVTAVILVRSWCAGNLDLCGTELGVIEEECSLGCSLLLECYNRRLGLAGGVNFDLWDLSAVIKMSESAAYMRSSGVILPETEEVLDLLLARLRADVGNVDCGSRHDFEFFDWFI